MPYHPAVEYRGDQYMFRGLSALGAGIGDFGSELFDEYQKQKDKRDKEQRERAADDQIMRYAMQNKMVDEQTLHDYQMADRKKQAQISHGIVQGFVERMGMQNQQQTLQMQQQYHAAETQRAAAEAQLAQARAAAVGRPMQPPQVTQLPNPGGQPITGIQTPRGGFQQIRQKPPTISKEDLPVVNWAMNRAPTPPDLDKKLPEDLKTKMTKIQEYQAKNPKDPRVNAAWAKLKSEIVVRYVTPNAPEVQPEQPESSSAGDNE